MAGLRARPVSIILKCVANITHVGETMGQAKKKNKPQRMHTAAGALLALAALTAAPQGHAAVCTGDSARNDALWTACMTIGKKGGRVGGYQRNDKGALDPAAVSGQSAANNVIRIVSGIGATVIAFDRHVHATTKNWILQVGTETFTLGEAKYIKAAKTYRWEEDPFEWTTANDGDQISVSLSASSTDAGPALLDATVNGTTMTLEFDEALKTSSVPAASAFAVTVGSESRSLAASDAVAVSGSNVTLTLAEDANNRWPVKVAYTKPASNPIEDEAGNDADSFEAKVKNETPNPLGRTLVFTPDPFVVPEGGTAAYTVTLDRAVGYYNTLTVFIRELKESETASDKISIRPQRLDFNRTNWETGLKVWVRAPRDGDGHDNRARIKHGGPDVNGSYWSNTHGSAHVLVTIRDTNEKPQVTNPIPNQNLVAGVAYSYTFPEDTFTDSNGDTITYSAARSFASWPEWLTFDAATRTFSGTPTNDDTGFYHIYVYAKDGIRHGGAITQDMFSLRVYETLEAQLTGRRLAPAHLQGAGGASVQSAQGCSVEVAVRFVASDGSTIEVTDLTTADFSIENGTLNAPTRSGDEWRIVASADPGFTGWMRVRLHGRALETVLEPTDDESEPVQSSTQTWPDAEQVFKVAGADQCDAVAANALAALALDGLTLDPAFDEDTHAYTAEAAQETGTTTVRASAVYESATVAITPEDADDDADGHQVTLGEGETVVRVTVSPSGTQAAASTTTITVTREASADVLTGFVLSDGASEHALEDASTVQVTSDGSYGIAVESAEDAEIASVVLALSGAKTVSRTENVAPWSLYGDQPGDGTERVLNTAALPAGAYTLTATAYAGRGGTGEVLGTRTVTFTAGSASAVTPAPAVITGLTLIDTSDQSTVATLAANASVDLEGDAGGSFGVRADVASDAGVRSVVLALSGAKTVSRTESLAPYSLYGDDMQGTLYGASLPAGRYTLAVTAYGESGGRGEALETRSVTFEVLAPAQLSVADARAQEGTDANLDFAVTLDRESTGEVTVSYATADGTATAGSDYTATSGTLTFAAGETEKTVSVPVLEDDHDEGSETLTLRLSNAQGATIADGEATGTISNSDAIPEAWLARFGRTVTGQVLDAVQDRLAASRQAGAEMSLAGQALPSWRGGEGAAANDDGAAAAAAAREEEEARRALKSMTAWLSQMEPGSGTDGAGAGTGGLEPQSRALTQRDLIVGTSFALTGGSKEGGGFGSLWGRASIAGFDGREGALTVDGEVTTGLIGADWSSAPGSGSGAGNWTAGLAVGHSTGTGGWRRGGACGVNCAGAIEAVLSGLYPYAGVTVGERLSVWAAAGYGAGEVTVTPEGGAGLTADLTMAMGAAGLRSEVLRPVDGNGLSLALKGDARFTRTSSDAVSTAGNLAAAEADVWLLRTGIEGSRPVVLSGSGSGTGGESGATLTPSFELGLRLDGGDAETGLGADLGGGVAFADSKNGLALDMKARGLVAHEASGFREWGASLAASWDPRPETDRGLSLSLAQSWGASPSGGMDALLSRETLAGLAANDEDGGAGFEASSRLEGELGYGLPAFGGAFTGTPNVGFGLSGGGARDWRLGWRLTSAIRGAPGFEVSLDATRSEPANDPGSGAGAPEHGVTLRGTIRW